jgi:hypothetical protein
MIVTTDFAMLILVAVHGVESLAVCIGAPIGCIL